MPGAAVPWQTGASRQSIGIGPHAFPPLPTEGPRGRREGGVRVAITTSQGLDDQKATGTNKRKTKQTGKDPAKVKIALWWTFRIDAQVRVILAEWDPNGPGNGGPFRILHPETEQRRVGDIIVQQMGEIEEVHGGTLFRVTLECQEWNPVPPVVTKGGTKTPKKSAEGGFSQGTTRVVDGGLEDSIGPAAAWVEASLEQARQRALEQQARGLYGANGPDAGP